MPPTKPWGTGNIDPFCTPGGLIGAQVYVPQGLVGGINQLCIQHTSGVKKPSKHVGHTILARFDENHLCFPWTTALYHGIRIAENTITKIKPQAL